MTNETLNWWYCDNIVHPQHQGQIGLLHLGEPMAFVLVRDYADAYFSSYDEFCEHIAEVNFLHPEDRANADIDELLRQAWNFIALQEQKEEELSEYYDED